jgi:hypothetical protein
MKRYKFFGKKRNDVEWNKIFFDKKNPKKAELLFSYKNETI